MRLYTFSVCSRPVVVVAVDTEMPLPDELATDTKVLDALRFQADLKAKVHYQIADYHELDEMIEGDIGSNLTVLQRDGVPIWSGNRAELSFREATTDEAAAWHLSRHAAISAGDLEAGYEDWVHLLVSVDNPTDLNLP